MLLLSIQHPTIYPSIHPSIHLSIRHSVKEAEWVGRKDRMNEQTNKRYRYVCAVKCKRIRISMDSSWLNQCLKLPLSFTNLWYMYIKKKNATFVMQYVLFTDCRFVTHITCTVTYEDRQAHTSCAFTHTHTQTCTHIQAHTYTESTYIPTGLQKLIRMGFYRIVNQTKCVRFTYI